MKAVIPPPGAVLRTRRDNPPGAQCANDKPIDNKQIDEEHHHFHGQRHREPQAEIPAVVLQKQQRGIHQSSQQREQIDPAEQPTTPLILRGGRWHVLLNILREIIPKCLMACAQGVQQHQRGENKKGNADQQSVVDNIVHTSRLPESCISALAPARAASDYTNFADPTYANPVNFPRRAAVVEPT